MMTGGVMDVIFFTHWEINSGMAIQRRLKEFYYEISWKSLHKIDLKIFVRKTMGVGNIDPIQSMRRYLKALMEPVAHSLILLFQSQKLQNFYMLGKYILNKFDSLMRK